MLRHETNFETGSSVTPSPPAAHIRVSPEELMGAIARLEARKDAGQRHLEGTIPIGEAVQQLGLEATPEDILAEVQAGRQQAMTRKKRSSIGERFVVALGLSGILLGLTLEALSFSQRDYQSPGLPSAVISSPQRLSLDPNLLVDTASDKLVMLSEVGDDHPVRCFYSDVSFEAFQPGSSGQAWTLIKHSGRVYVRGWMHKMSPRVLHVNGADIAAIQSPDFSVPVTLPVSGFQIVPGAGSSVEFHAVNVQPDKYTWEKW